MNKKQVIRLTESQFHQIVKETVKKVMNEVEVPRNVYCWEINELFEEEDGRYNVLDNAENSGQRSFKTEADAYRNGIKALKHYYKGDYELVVYLIDNEGSDMVCGAEIHNGKLMEF